MFTTALEKCSIRPDLLLDFQRISTVDLGFDLKYSAQQSRDAAAVLSIKEGRLTGKPDNDPSLLLAAIANCSEFFARLVGFARKALISTHQDGFSNSAVERAKQQLFNAQFIMKQESVLNDIYDLFVKQPPNPNESLSDCLFSKAEQFSDADEVSIALRRLAFKVNWIFGKLNLPQNSSIKLFANQGFKLVKITSDEIVSFYKINDSKFDEIKDRLTGNQVQILNTIFEMLGLQTMPIIN